MSDKEKFEGFKQNMIDENEKKYGEEIRKNMETKRLINPTVSLKT